MGSYVRKADLEAARSAIRLAPGAHHPREIASAGCWAILNGGSKLYTPAQRRRWDELAAELDRRWEAARRWGYDPARDPVLHPEADRG